MFKKRDRGDLLNQIKSWSMVTSTMWLWSVMGKSKSRLGFAYHWLRYERLYYNMAEQVPQI